MKKKTSKSQPGDMLPEYNLEGKKGVRGKYAKAMQKGYSVRILNEDGTVTVRDLFSKRTPYNSIQMWKRKPYTPLFNQTYS